jgi:hypothetical protein
MQVGYCQISSELRRDTVEESERRKAVVKSVFTKQPQISGLSSGAFSRLLVRRITDAQRDEIAADPRVRFALRYRLRRS